MHKRPSSPKIYVKDIPLPSSLTQSPCPLFQRWKCPSTPRLPSMRSSMAFLTPLSKARASAGLWKVSPNFLLSTFQWWKVGLAFVYTRSFFTKHSSTTWEGREPPKEEQSHFSHPRMQPPPSRAGHKKQAKSRLAQGNILPYQIMTNKHQTL